MKLDEIEYIAQQIQLVDNEFSEEGVVSILEGGYNFSGGIISSFSQSVFTYVRFLISI